MAQRFEGQGPIAAKPAIFGAAPMPCMLRIDYPPAINRWTIQKHAPVSPAPHCIQNPVPSTQYPAVQSTTPPLRYSNTPFHPSIQYSESSMPRYRLRRLIAEN